MNIASITSQSLSAASSGSPTATASTGSGSFKDLWAQVGHDLNKGDLTGAQSAFAQIKSLYQQNGGNTSGPHTGPLSTDIRSLAQALNSNSLTGAQAAFTQLRQDWQASQAAGGGSQSTSVLASSSTSSLLNVLA